MMINWIGRRAEVLHRPAVESFGPESRTGNATITARLYISPDKDRLCT